jgi:hypothetical protein
MLATKAGVGLGIIELVSPRRLTRALGMEGRDDRLVMNHIYARVGPQPGCSAGPAPKPAQE